MTIITFKHKDGSEEFTCTGCGKLVLSPVPTNNTLCFVCKFWTDYFHGDMHAKQGRDHW